MPPTGSNRNIQQQLNAMLATSQNKSYFVGAVTVLFVIFMVVFGILPSYSAFTAQGEKNAKRQEVIDKLEKKKKDLEDLTVDESNNAELVRIFNTILPEAPAQVKVLNEVDTLATNNNIILINSAFSESRTNNDIVRKYLVTNQIKAQTLTILLDGTRENLNNFVRDLEDNIRVFDVKNMVISRKVGKELEETTEGRQYKLNLQLDYFYFDKSSK